MKDTFYFTHDYNTRSDSKVTKLLAKHGMRGYGLFWAIIEDLYNNANVLRLDYDCLSYALREDVEVIKSVIHDFDLFVFEDGNFGSKSVQKRLEERNAKSEKARESAIKRWSASERNANAEQTQSEGNAIKESKGKETKEIKETKEDELIDFNNLLKLINLVFDKKYRKINDSVKRSYLARIKDGFTKDDIRAAITNASKNQWAKDQKFNFCTPEYFSRLNSLEQWVNYEQPKEIKKPELPANVGGGSMLKAL